MKRTWTWIDERTAELSTSAVEAQCTALMQQWNELEPARPARVAGGGVMNTITLSLSMPDRAALGRITHNIRDVATDIVSADTTPDALAFAQLCRFALRWLDAATAAVERTFEVEFDLADRAALTVCEPYLRHRLRH